MSMYFVDWIHYKDFCMKKTHNIRDLLILLWKKNYELRLNFVEINVAYVLFALKEKKLLKQQSPKMCFADIASPIAESAKSLLFQQRYCSLSKRLPSSNPELQVYRLLEKFA